MRDYVEVKTQAELDKAIADGDIPICRDGFFSASGSATVRAYGSATVRAYGSATVRASGSATVEAYGSATVEAYGSATVEAYDSATVEAYDSATVEASGSATVEASGSATVRASGSATVRASDSATVRASDSATVRAYDSATVEASPFVAIHRHGDTPKVNGGVLIQVPPVTTVAEWADFHGLKVTRGTVTVYKAVRDDLRSHHGGDYSGKTVKAPDFGPYPSRGNGLHFSQTPHHARRYDLDATRFLACTVKVADAVLIGGGAEADKIKAPACRVVGEVDIDGEPLAPVSTSEASR